MATINELSQTSYRLPQLMILLSAISLSGVTSVDIQLPVALNNFDFKSLPIYCKGSTMHFECRDNTGAVHCLPLSLKCRIQCANDAELKCPTSDTNCTADQFRCATSSDTLICLPDEHLCDGRAHCPAGDDESPQLCHDRNCPPGRFACQSPGHCLPASRRCDGHQDCLRPGLDDRSDESNCPTVPSGPVAADGCPGNPGAFRCADGSGCVDRSYVCDGFPDCADFSDEACGPAACAPGEFDCDGRCLPALRVRCDGRIDCKSGADELDCPEPPPSRPSSVATSCSFTSEFHCRYSGVCVPAIFVCDGVDDCKGGTAEDETCPVGASDVCRRPDYWTCASGTHCVPASARCDGHRQCPDGSDEKGCTTTGSPMTSAVSPVEATSFTPPVGGTATEDEGCSFGRCSQLCDPGSGRCDCWPGYQLTNDRSCVAHGAGKLVVVEASGTVELIDLETGRTITRFEGLGATPGRVALDAAERRLVFVDTQGRLASVRLSDGGGRREIGDGYDDVADVAYDWTRRLLFYSTPGLQGSVGVVDIAGGGWRAVLRVLDCPGALAVDPRSDGPPGLFVALGCGRQPGLYQMSLDGRDLRLLLDATAAGRPTQLKLDLTQSPPRIYWTPTDSRGGILSARLDGKDLRLHAVANPSPVVALEVFEDNIYAASASGDLIQLTDKFSANFVSRRRFEFAPKLAVSSCLVQHTALQPRGAGLNATACRVCQQICLPAAAGSSNQVACLCDQRHRADPRTGRCTPVSPAVRDFAERKPKATRTASQSSVTSASSVSFTSSSPTAASPAVLTAVVLSAAAVAALLAGVTVFCARRHHGKQSVELEEPKLNDGDEKNRSVDSRTPLTSSTVVSECKMV